MSNVRRWTPLAGLAVVASVALAAIATGLPRAHAQAPAALPAPAPPDLVGHGRYLTAAGDCQACHTRQGGAPFSGGRPLATPFGTILSANITPDATGIGGWSSDQFYRALHSGVDDEGHHLYPAFPYNYYTRMPRADTDAVFAYLKTVAPVKTHFERNRLPFPFNIRGLMVFWNWLFLHEGSYKPNPAKSAEWNRGAYLVTGPGHCGACHTPMNLFGAPKRGHDYQGGKFGLWFAPDLTPNHRTGLGGWTRPELLEFLKAGRNVHAQASGEMGEVVAYSTSQMTDQDLNAIATYLADQPTSPAARVNAPDPAVMRQGEAIWVDACSACHRMSAAGVPRFFPPLQQDANLQQRDPTTILHLVLGGARSTPTDKAPTPLSMPSFAWKLNDGQIAAVTTYIRNSWGNAAPSVSSGDVAKLRKKLTFGRGPAESLRPPPLTHPGPATFAPAGTDSRDNGTAQAGRAAKGGAAGGSGSGATNGGADKGHPGGVSTGGPG